MRINSKNEKPEIDDSRAEIPHIHKSQILCESYAIQHFIDSDEQCYSKTASRKKPFQE